LGAQDYLALICLLFRLVKQICAYTRSFRKFFFFPYRFQPVGASPRKTRKNKTRTDNNNNNNNNNKKKPFKVKIHGARLGTPKNGGGAMSSQFSISTFTFAPGVLFCIFLDSFLFLVHLHDASTSIIRLGAFEKRRRPIFFSFGSVGRRHRPTKTKSRRQTKTARAKRKPISSAIIMVGQLREKGRCQTGDEETKTPDTVPRMF
jgi:hypothetical protein